MYDIFRNFRLIIDSIFPLKNLVGWKKTVGGRDELKGGREALWRLVAMQPGYHDGQNDRKEKKKILWILVTIWWNEGWVSW